MPRKRLRQLRKVLCPRGDVFQKENNVAGLGMALCKFMTSAFGGSISVRSKEGLGTLVTVFFTLEDKIKPGICVDSARSLESEDYDLDSGSESESGGSYDSSYESESNEDRHLNLTNLTFKRKSSTSSLLRVESFTFIRAEDLAYPRILIVDDQMFNIDALLILLHVSGVNVKNCVHRAFSGSQALDQVKCQDSLLYYHIIFMSCFMPVVDGFEATREIRKFLKSKCLPQPLIFGVTANSDEACSKRAKACSMDEVLFKPLRPEHVKDSLARSRAIFKKAAPPSESPSSSEIEDLLSDDLKEFDVAEGSSLDKSHKSKKSPLKSASPGK
uniref:Response regulatory domain-containing protein n=1 Tax=Strombidium inclinatum TaxID=197538 RepID=A0A7S3IPS8_9SPIT|mmetsp:Transcript_32808/g.50098  ORF Transcript_32808/g.50098 Transcript_32808/m.50098 type:complete len:329 (+) Transcript_32808:2234-3220(+)